MIEQEVRSKISITDQEVTEFFAANRAQFNVPEEAYHIAQIVVTPVRDQQSANRSGDDALDAAGGAAKAQMLMERLKGGASFGELAIGLLGGSRVGPARRRPGLRARVEAEAGAAAAARRGAQQGSRAG